MRSRLVFLVILVLGIAVGGCQLHGDAVATPGHEVSPEPEREDVASIPVLSRVTGEELESLLEIQSHLVVVVHSDRCEACYEYKKKTLRSLVEEDRSLAIYLLEVTPNYPWILEQGWADRIMHATRRDAVTAPTTIFFDSGSMVRFFLGMKCPEAFQAEKEQAYQE